MAMRPAQPIERELDRISQVLEVPTLLAEKSNVAVPEVASRTTSLTALRVVAIVGAALVVVVIVLAFSRSLTLGALSLAAAPIIPLTLVVVTDRVFRR